MSDPKETLSKILKQEKDRIRSSYPSNDVIFPLVEIIRTLDYHTFALNRGTNTTDQSLLFEKYRFGWSLAFQLYYNDLTLNDSVPLFAFESQEREWVDQIVQHSGAVQLTSQFLDYCKSGLMNLSSIDNNNFTFNYSVENPGLEYFEKMSIDYYFSIIEEVLAEKKKVMIGELPTIRTSLESIVQVMHDKFISYRANDDLDRFYTRFGYLYLMTTQIVDDFDEGDLFGGIPYKKYMDQVEHACKAAIIMHRDCCMALTAKTSGKIQLRDTLTYGFSLNAFSNLLSEYLDTTTEVVRETVSCLTTNKENFLHHLSYPGVSASPYLQIGNDTLMRSIYGCLDMPVLFLNRELKRKYPKDFFNAVNNREARFRSQLYDLFHQERIMKIYENIIIRSSKGATDIDGVLFDKQRSILGLFQLKWQDSFSTSMKERFSRISNLIPKSIEWIDKVCAWLAENDEKTILSTLKINSSYSKIEDVYLFVLSRNHVHFTNQKLDDRAIWSSWFQVLESSAKVKDPTSSNPIGEFAAKLKFFSPSHRIKWFPLPVLSDIDFKFSRYVISFKTNS